MYWEGGVNVRAKWMKEIKRRIECEKKEVSASHWMRRFNWKEESLAAFMRTFSWCKPCLERHSVSTLRHECCHQIMPLSLRRDSHSCSSSRIVFILLESVSSSIFTHRSDALQDCGHSGSCVHSSPSCFEISRRDQKPSLPRIRRTVMITCDDDKNKRHHFIWSIKTNKQQHRTLFFLRFKNSSHRFTRLLFY